MLLVIRLIIARTALAILAFAALTLPAIAQEPPAANALYIIYDSSNSMWGELSDKSRKYEAGRKALSTFLETDLKGRTLAFRAYGHRRAGDCTDSQLIVPFGDQADVREQINKTSQAIRPTGKTPITRSLKAALTDFDGRKGDIVLISDGIETCDIDPCALMDEWRQKNINIRVHVVGVGLNELERQAMSCVAQTSGGIYLDAESSDELSDALITAGTQEIPPPGEPNPAPQTQGFALKIYGNDDQGRSFHLNGELFKSGESLGAVSSNGRHSLEEGGDYSMTVGVLLRDGTLFDPQTIAFSITEPGTHSETLLVKRPAIVSAKFIEDGEDHRGSHVSAYQNGEEVFSFRTHDEALARGGIYEFRATPNKDNDLKVEATLTEGEESVVTFELVNTLKYSIRYRLPDGKIFKRGAKLYKDGEEVYSVFASNTNLALPGTYEVRSAHDFTPVSGQMIELSEDGQDIVLDVDAGFLVIDYAPSEDSYFRKANRAFIDALDRNVSLFGRIETRIALTPGAYRVNGHSGAGIFEPINVDIKSGEESRVTLVPEPLGQLVVEYAPSDKYTKTPDRANVYGLEGQVVTGLARPGKPKKLPTGRYRIKGVYADIPEQEFTIKPHETTTVTLTPR